MIAFSAIACGIGLFFVEESVAWVLGVAIGLLVALVRLRLIHNTLSKAVNMPEEKAKGYTQRQYMLRYIGTGVLLVGVVMMPGISLVGVVIGLLSMKAAAYGELYTKHK